MHLSVGLACIICAIFLEQIFKVFFLRYCVVKPREYFLRVESYEKNRKYLLFFEECLLVNHSSITMPQMLETNNKITRKRRSHSLLPFSSSIESHENPSKTPSPFKELLANTWYCFRVPYVVQSLSRSSSCFISAGLAAFFASHLLAKKSIGILRCLSSAWLSIVSSSSRATI